MQRMVRRRLSPGTNMERGARAEGEWPPGPAFLLWLHLTITLSWEKNPGNHSASLLLRPCSVPSDSMGPPERMFWPAQQFPVGSRPPAPLPTPTPTVSPSSPPPGWVTPVPSPGPNSIQFNSSRDAAQRDSGLFCSQGARGLCPWSPQSAGPLVCSLNVFCPQLGLPGCPNDPNPACLPPSPHLAPPQTLLPPKLQ